MKSFKDVLVCIVAFFLIICGIVDVFSSDDLFSGDEGF